MDDHPINPYTGRRIQPGKATYRRFIDNGYQPMRHYYNERDYLIFMQKPVNIMDVPIPDIKVAPLKPSITLQNFKNKIVKNASSIADWLWKFIENRKKNASEIADWILAQTDKVIKKVLPPKVEELIELSKRTPYNSKKMYWQINMPSNPRYEDLISEKVKKARLAYEKEYYNKYFKMYYYMHITSLEDVHENLNKTYKDENNAFKLLLSFGYITEKKKENDTDDYEIKLYEPTQQYFYDKPQTIKNKNDMNNLLSNINGEKIIHKLASKFPDTKTRLIGVFCMAVKVIRLDYPIGTKTQLPDYIKKSNFIIGLEDVENNFCFWACLALAEGCTKNRYTNKAKELFNKFYKMQKFDEYKGFDFINELDKYEAFNTKYAINIVCYNKDKSIEYIRRSEFNPDRRELQYI